MVFAAQKLRLHTELGNPTVMIVADRIDLDTQITATFNAADVPNMVSVTTRQELQTLLAQDVRKVLITTIHKFAKTDGNLNERSNIIVLVDEAHRTQEGDLGRKMREALPNAFLFGLTGTPINRADRNTFWAFGADEDEKGYMSRYSFQESIHDRATLPLHFETPEVKLQIDRPAIDEAYQAITGYLSEQDRDDLAKQAAKMAVIVKNPERIRAVVNHIVGHYQTRVEPNGFKAQVVTFDRECCVLYKQVMDELVDPEASAIVMISQSGDPPEWKAHARDRDAEERLFDRFRDPADPLKFIIITNKLLAGFYALILQVMYLDKPMKDHNPVELINKNIHVQSVWDDVEALVLDAQVLAEILGDAEPEKRGREIEIKLIARLRRHVANPAFIALGERLEKVRERHEQGFLTSLEFLKAILEVARDVVEAERETDPEEERDRAREALTELFNEAKNKATHIIVERIVTDIDEIMKKVRFPDWQHTSQGERLVQKELRRTLLKYRLHTDQELFDRAYAYIRQYY